MSECAGCGSESAKNRCGGCNQVYYCDKQCQRKHWKTHKKQCKFKKKKKKKRKAKEKLMVNDDDDKKMEETHQDFNNKDIKKTLEFIGDSNQKYLSRLDEITELLQPNNIPINEKRFEEIEKNGLWQIYDKVLDFSYNHLKTKQDNMITQKSLNIQMIVQNFHAAIVMNKHATMDGTDTVREKNCVKLLHFTKFWSRNMEMIVMDQCHVEYKRALFRILTLILNFEVCGKYILEHLTDFKKNKQQEIELNNLCNLCQDGIEDAAHDALQGLANQCFCQLYIHCQQLKIRDDLKQFLDDKKNIYFNFAYPMAKAQINKRSAMSFDDLDRIIKEQASMS